MDNCRHPVIKLMRPHQWIKNSFVFVGIMFSRQLQNLELLLQVILIALAFCLMSSAVYIINDYLDRVVDRLHPSKKTRPLAAGTFPVNQAIFIASLLFMISLGLSIIVSWQASIILASYLLLNFAYSLYLKHIAIVDVIVISIGFMLRILAGTIGVGIVPSCWLFICGILLTLFLGFTKRLAEISHNKAFYNIKLLNIMIAITGLGCIIAYGFYVVYQCLQLQKPFYYTLLWVIYGMGRYIYLLYDTDYLKLDADIAQAIFHDRQLMFANLAWLISALWLLA